MKLPNINYLNFSFLYFPYLKSREFWSVARHLIYKSADVLFILSEDEKALFAIVGAHCQGEHVKAGLRTLKYADCKFYASKDFVSCAS